MFLSLTNHSSAVSRVILLSCPLDRWVVVNLRGLTHTHTHSHKSHEGLSQPVDASQHMCV